jgi:spermidine/putrescine-binding protein
MTKMATQRQTWALFCATKIDYRDKNLTYDEASKLLAEANEKNGYVGKEKKDKKVNQALQIHNDAVKAGLEALNKCTPTPMVVQEHTNMLDDSSPVAKEWFVEGGVCGFAWIQFKANTPENRAFLTGLKQSDLVGKGLWDKAYGGGYSYWVSEGGQSLERKIAFAGAFSQVLRDNGIKAYAQNRID